MGWKGKTAINSGCTFDVNGATFDGVANIIDTNYNPSIDAVNLSQNNAIMGAFIKVATGSGFRSAIGGRTTLPTLLLGGNSGTNFVNFHVNANEEYRKNVAGGFANNTLYVGSRITAGASSGYVNGVLDGTDNAAPSGVIKNAVIDIGSYNTSLFYQGTISTVIFAGAIGFDNAAHNTNIRALLTSIGTLP